jgi:phosphatidylinositol alpha-1,6-mannosyltransferase
LSTEDLRSLWCLADVFALTPVDVWDDRGLDAEGFGLVFLEAAARGIPAIGSICGGCADAIADGTTGYLIDPFDNSTVAGTITQLLRHPRLRSKLGGAAKGRARLLFRWEDRIGRLLVHYGASAPLA